MPEEEWSTRFPHIAADEECVTPEHFEATFEVGIDTLLNPLPRSRGKETTPRVDSNRQGRLW